jgi:hypothetical protein
MSAAASTGRAPAEAPARTNTALLVIDHGAGNPDGEAACGIYHPRTRLRLGTAATRELANDFCLGFADAVDGAAPVPAAGARGREARSWTVFLGDGPTTEQADSRRPDAYRAGYAAGLACVVLSPPPCA